MNLKEKLEIAKSGIGSIMKHDDAPFEAVQAQAAAMKQYIDDELQAALQRRAAAAGVALGDRAPTSR